MSHYDNMTDLANYNRNILSPLCGVTFTISSALTYILYRWYGFDIPTMTRMIFLFCICSLAISFYVIFTLQNKTLTIKDKEWRIERTQKDLAIRMKDIEQRERHLNQKTQQIEQKNLALEKKRQEYVVFDFK